MIVLFCLDFLFWNWLVVLLIFPRFPSLLWLGLFWMEMSAGLRAIDYFSAAIDYWGEPISMDATVVAASSWIQLALLGDCCCCCCCCSLGRFFPVSPACQLAPGAPPHWWPNQAASLRFLQLAQLGCCCPGDSAACVLLCVCVCASPATWRPERGGMAWGLGGVRSFAVDYYSRWFFIVFELRRASIAAICGF